MDLQENTWGFTSSAENINILVLWGGKWKILVTE
jgi:hypothetical protein